MRNSLVLGFFDGVHIAHQAVILSAVGNPTLVTFKSSPAEYFNKEIDYIYTREDSIEKIKALGVKEVLELEFSEIAGMEAEDYLKFLVEKYSPVSISTGFNHTFGLNRMGNADFLYKMQEKYNYNYICTPALKDNNEIVSSTLIKKLLRSGEIERANKLLGSSFLLRGKVIEGAKLGREIGFPTANINYPPRIVKIPYGVYRAKVGNKNAILNWGVKPTVNNTSAPVLEVHIIDFNDFIYDKEIKIEVLKKIRNEQKFNNIEELKEQIKKDILECLE